MATLLQLSANACAAALAISDPRVVADVGDLPRELVELVALSYFKFKLELGINRHKRPSALPLPTSSNHIPALRALAESDALSIGDDEHGERPLGGELPERARAHAQGGLVGHGQLQLRYGARRVVEGRRRRGMGLRLGHLDPVGMGLRLGHQALLFSMKNHRKYALAFSTGVAIAHRGELQARSAEKREQRRKESLERYSVNNFNDFFAVDNKSLVRHADGTFEALPKDVIAEGLKNGRIKYGARSAGIADFSTTRAPFEFNESVAPATTPSSSNENLQ